MKRIALIGLIFIVLAMVFYGCSDKTTEPEINRVSTPEFNPPGGQYDSDIDVVIYSKTVGALIRYTTNGSEPTHTSSVYSQPIHISFMTNTTIKAKAYISGYEDSEIVTAIYHSGEPPSGEGTINNPYQIAYFDNLVWLAADSSSWDKHFIQVSDINANETSNWEDGGWIPIGKETTEFTGNYDGNGFIIDGLYINRPETNSQGLFGYTDTATIKNLGVENVDVSGRSYVGGLVGVSGGSNISNSYSTGSVSGDEYVGGLVGSVFQSSIISNSYSTGSVTGGIYFVGGLVGYIWGSTISDSYSTGSVTGELYVGGLVGGNSQSTISNSYSTGSVTGELYVGGLVGSGDSQSTISNCYSTGSVTGRSYVGGLAGFNDYSTISNSYSTGSVTGRSYVGGLVGSNHWESTINNSYSTGSVTGEWNYVGGLVGRNYSSTISNSYWDIQTSGLTMSDGGEGRTTAEMTYPYAENTYVDWDFEIIWKADTNYSVNNGYPYLRWQISRNR